MNNHSTNTPLKTLSAWLALEVLSPQTFKKKVDLAGSFGSIVDLNAGAMPWEGEGEASKPDYVLYYQVVIGSIDFKKTITKLLEIYADTRVEKQSPTGEAILATIIVDRNGVPVGKPLITISSFAWGAAKALQKSLSDLVNWGNIESQLTNRIEDLLSRNDDEGNPIPLDIDTINYIRAYLIEELELPLEYYTDSCFAVRTYQYKNTVEPPEPLLLNSFFLGDLNEAHNLFNNNKATNNLNKYLKNNGILSKSNILKEKKVLEAAIAPSKIPIGRWPGPGRYPLVLLQQAAVNLIFQELRVEGIMAVNGPPGTGKTTLLRDIVAEIVTNRAEVMCKFTDPNEAFEDSGEKVAIGAGGAFFRLFRLDEKIKGFEILIASSNNKAVENVSTELPGINAIADDAEGLRYFSTLAEALFEKESWGIAAAPLGNASNIGTFRNKFWGTQKSGFGYYLAVVSGAVKDGIEGIRAENPPINQEEALDRWHLARADFLKAKEVVEKRLLRLEGIRQVVLKLTELEEVEKAAKQRLDNAVAAESETRQALDLKLKDESLINAELEELHSKEISCLKRRPGFWARLFRTIAAKEWKYEYNSIRSAIHREEKGLEDLNRLIDTLRHRYHQSSDNRQICYQQHQQAIANVNAIKDEIETFRDVLGSHLIDNHFFTLSHEERHLVAPWCNDEVQRLRDEVFIKAMHLHKAFIDAAAKPIRHNLGNLMNVLSGKKLASNGQISLLADLWSTLFLVIPCLSTTFASVRKMLGNLPKESLGWLLVDEAGQALPQAAVGAIMRTKRVVMVGDPIQIEPVVVLPELLTQSICKSLGVDSLLFNAPVASAQTLADDVTPYYAEFEGLLGSRTVGIPLLVHRRCEDPMFGVSNAIAYNGLMVKAKRPGKSEIRDCLGKSAWIDVKSESVNDKWSYDEGVVVVRLLEKLKAGDINPDVYIITPFVVVADGLRRLIRESGVLIDWVEDPKNWLDSRIGTVHTVQGREAEAVFFVLGAPQVNQAGARNWAGGKPNLANVAVTRAKEVMYVIGNWKWWKDAGVFGEVSDKIRCNS